jgi:hypothetical protein
MNEKSNAVSGSRKYLRHTPIRQYHSIRGNTHILKELLFHTEVYTTFCLSYIKDIFNSTGKCKTQQLKKLDEIKRRYTFFSALFLELANSVAWARGRGGVGLWGYGVVGWGSAGK